jgi:hypothetical protein
MPGIDLKNTGYEGINFISPLFFLVEFMLLWSAGKYLFYHSLALIS